MVFQATDSSIIDLYFYKDCSVSIFRSCHNHPLYYHNNLFYSLFCSNKSMTIHINNGTTEKATINAAIFINFLERIFALVVIPMYINSIITNINNPIIILVIYILNCLYFTKTSSRSLLNANSNTPTAIVLYNIISAGLSILNLLIPVYTKHVLTNRHKAIHIGKLRNLKLIYLPSSLNTLSTILLFFSLRNQVKGLHQLLLILPPLLVLLLLIKKPRLQQLAKFLPL